MNRPTPAAAKAAMVNSTMPDPTIRRSGLISLLLLSAWCGLVAGLLEAGAIVLRRRAFDLNPLYRMSRHFVWLIPLTNVCVFLLLGLFGGAIVLAWPRRGRWLFSRLLCAMTILPVLLVAFPRIYAAAWLIVVLGVAARIVPILEHNGRRLRRSALLSFPVAVAIAAIPGASIWMGDRVRQGRESARAMPPSGSPNVLLVVMDTLAVDHLSLHGYDRPTSTTLVELSEHGVRFDSARAACSWTLPSHATMFTGRWLHELSVGWLTPLDATHPTLAEFLGGRGYATAGFVGNTWYCAADSGLARGFTRYRDFSLRGLTGFTMAALVSHAMDSSQAIIFLTEDWLESAGLLPHLERLWRSLTGDRKDAAEVNREFLGWLTSRPEPGRPFFAFLNYFDTHCPYQLPRGRLHRFGVEPSDDHQRALINQWWYLDKSTLSPNAVAFAIDAYDDCIASLDEQIGKLVDELERRGLLETTWLIITSDHGESFGEHAGVFCHGTSLYETELHVPLLVIPPGRGTAKRVVEETVSLRDLAATIADVSGFRADAPFPGTSLARFWKHPGQEALTQDPSVSPALAEVVPNDPRNRDSSGAPRQLAPLAAVKERAWSYIRREGDIREELFHLSGDPTERRDLAGDPSSRATLQRMRAALRTLTAGPLLPGRLPP